MPTDHRVRKRCGSVDISFGPTTRHPSPKGESALMPHFHQSELSCGAFAWRGSALEWRRGAALSSRAALMTVSVFRTRMRAT